MSQRFCLFYAGYTSYAPTLYYDQVILFDKLNSSDNETLKARVETLLGDLEPKALESATFIETALSIARDLEIVTPKPDGTPPGYLEWRKSFIARMEEAFPMTRIDHYYFLFGRRLAEMICNAALVCRYIILLKHTERDALVLKQMDKAMKDMQYVLFKMMASAALLSGEIKHHYFSVFYKEINAAFKPFNNIEVKQLNDSELEKLAADLENYGLLVMEGFKKCIGLLKDLGI